jgi:hypothetical protein
MQKSENNFKRIDNRTERTILPTYLGLALGLYETNNGFLRMSSSIHHLNTSYQIILGICVILSKLLFDIF